MQARDVMTRPVITLRPETSIKDAAVILVGNQITAAPVVNADEEIIGMVSEADLIQHRFHHDPRSSLLPDPREDQNDTPPRTVGEVMTRVVVALSASADAADLADAMLSYDIRSIPIVEGSSVVGIVSRRDLLRTLARDPDLIRSEVLDRLSSYTGNLVNWQVEVRDDQVDLYGAVNDDGEAWVLRILAGSVPGVSAVTLHPSP